VILLLHLLASLLLLLSFAFGLTALESRAWATMATFTDATRSVSAGVWTRGPRGGAVPSADPPYNTTTSSQRCGAAFFDDPWFCQQVDAWAAALTAGVALTGVGAVASLAVLAAGMLVRVRVRGTLGWGRRERKRERAAEVRAARRGVAVEKAMLAATLMVMVPAALATLLGSIKLLDLYTNYQSPDASWVDGRGNIDLTLSHWMWHVPDAQYAVVAWAPAVVALVLYFPGLVLREGLVVVEDEGHED
jgi:hypothetical protein